MYSRIFMYIHNFFFKITPADQRHQHQARKPFLCILPPYVSWPHFWAAPSRAATCLWVGEGGNNMCCIRCRRNIHICENIHDNISNDIGVILF